MIRADSRSGQGKRRKCLHRSSVGVGTSLRQLSVKTSAKAQDKSPLTSCNEAHGTYALRQKSGLVSSTPATKGSIRAKAVRSILTTLSRILTFVLNRC